MGKGRTVTTTTNGTVYLPVLTIRDSSTRHDTTGLCLRLGHKDVNGNPYVPIPYRIRPVQDIRKPNLCKL